MRLPAVAVSLVVFLMASVGSGCGGTVLDDAKTEAQIEQNLEQAAGKKVRAVECPSGVEIEAGETFDCAVTLAGGEEETATIKILDEDANTELADLKPAK
ncbi:MAG TPA: DUF4333 domain-containing protein [Solirubrobacterales bacterium]|nr:DUF4333 domain-containing protein [Solirubrobacterales bacterium]